MHDASKVLMGATRSNIKDVSNFPGNPTTFVAGLGVRVASTGILSVTKAHGELVGVSMGRPLDGLTDKTVVARAGLGIPVKLKTGETPAIGEQCGVDDASGEFASIDTGITGVNAIFVTAAITGIDEAGNEIDVAIIDMPGGL